MNTKINLQQLAKILAQKKNIPQKDAETFLKEFFDSIVQNVTSDKLVKIKGLGTFKLIEVLDRESVNVNTGERFVIPGHSKLSFTPETALKDLINKPFADFQTTVINEGTSIEEMERVPQQEEEAETEEEIEQEVSAQLVEPEVEEKPIVAETPVQKLVDEPVEVHEPEAKAEETPAPKPDYDEEKPKGSFGKILAWILGILLLCVLVFFAYKYLSSMPSAQVEDESELIEEVPADSLAETPAPEVQYAQVPGGKYKIVGTKKTYVMKRGDFLTRIAIQEYGDKDVAQYIIVHNNFPDPDNVPVDAEIKLPELEPVE
ncbi:MAG: HU family DNA-binding protein [Bacteroidaceae bacterium]|nr:HU family DNA-binding protein [Bacteroidaceae bacterium]